MRPWSSFFCYRGIFSDHPPKVDSGYQTMLYLEVPIPQVRDKGWEY